MNREDFMDAQAPAVSGHKFTVDFLGCATSGCHPSPEQAIAAKSTLDAESRGRLDDILARLGDPATWEYTSAGGPADQSTISDNVKKVRFLLKYVESDGSLGLHNPSYVRDMLIEADVLRKAEGK